MASTLKFKKIFVAGGNGFVGQRVVLKLRESGTPFVSLSRRDGIDFRDARQTIDLFQREKFDAVINCAAYVGGIAFGYAHPGELFYNNAQMSSNLMEAARLTGVRRFANPISNCSYPGDMTVAFKEGEWWSGPLHESVLAYGLVRKSSWVQAWGYYKQYGLESVSVILPNMYGPGDHFEEARSHALGALVMKFVEARRNNMPQVVVWGSGKPVREWLYVDDGAEALMRALEIPYTIDPINVGMGHGISVIDMANVIKDTAGYRGKIVLDTSKPDGAPYKTMDVTRMRQVFNWGPQTGLKEGVRKTVAWYEENVK